MRHPVDVGDEKTGSGCSMLQQRWHRRKRKKALHASLKNPRDLYWDAVWIEPEDIMGEVTSHGLCLDAAAASMACFCCVALVKICPCTVQLTLFTALVMMLHAQ